MCDVQRADTIHSIAAAFEISVNPSVTQVAYAKFHIYGMYISARELAKGGIAFALSLSGLFSCMTGSVPGPSWEY